MNNDFRLIYAGKTSNTCQLMLRNPSVLVCNNQGRILRFGAHVQIVLSWPTIYFPRPTDDFSVSGLFHFRQHPQTRALARILRLWELPCGEGRKGRFGAFSGCFPAVFLRLKRPPTFPLTRLSPPQIPLFSAFFMDRLTWMSRENTPKSSLKKNREGF